MDTTIACCVGVDLASAILVTLQEMPPGTDYIVQRDAIPSRGRIISTRVRDVDVNGSRIANGQPFGGSPFASITIDVTMDADVANVTPNGVFSGAPATDIHVIMTMSLVWRGTMYDPENVPPPNPPAARALENFRLRGQPRIAWGAVGASASINGLPDWLGPGHVVPPVVPALTWPDECAIGSWQTDVYNAPDDIKLDLANLFSAALVKLVAGLIVCVRPATPYRSTATSATFARERMDRSGGEHGERTSGESGPMGRGSGRVAAQRVDAGRVRGGAGAAARRAASVVSAAGGEPARRVQTAG